MNKDIEVKIVPISSIWLTERFRKDLGEIVDLAHSIKTHGIIQPLAVNRVDGPNGKLYKLLAGGRRFSACERVGLEEVPVRIYPIELNDYQARLIELEENIQRKDLTYIEDINLKKEVHELYQKLYGKKVSTSQDASGWSLRDTAKLLNRDHTGVSKDITLAKAMVEFPELGWKSCKNKKEASKMLEKFTSRIVRAELADRVSEVISKGDKKLVDSFIVGDFFKLAKNLQSKSFNVIEVDPPYSINLESVKSNAENLDVYTDVKQDDYVDFLTRTIQECWRLLSNDSWLIFWFGPEPWFETIYEILTETGFSTRRLVGIWNKATGQTHYPSKYLGNSYEMFYYAAKGNPQITLEKRGRSNVFSYSPVPPMKKIHPTERPLDLIKELLSTFAYEGSRVLVPFAGSGKTLVAAYELSMFPIGYDLMREHRDSFVAKLVEGG